MLHVKRKTEYSRSNRNRAIKGFVADALVVIVVCLMFIKCTGLDMR